MKLPYFKITDAFNDVKSEFGYGDLLSKTTSIAKLTGKTIANVGMFAAEIAGDVIKNAPAHVGDMAKRSLKENKNLSDERREKLENIVKKGNDFKEKKKNDSQNY